MVETDAFTESRQDSVRGCGSFTNRQIVELILSDRGNQDSQGLIPRRVVGSAIPALARQLTPAATQQQQQESNNMSYLRKTTATAFFVTLMMATPALAIDGGASPDTPMPASRPGQPTVKGTKVVVKHGLAYAPLAAPAAVKKIVWGGNKIRSLKYLWGGGHGSWRAPGYDCSGSASFALHEAGLLNTTLVSGEFASWGRSGRGKWVTIYANSGHVFLEVAGARFDTSGASPSRWQSDLRSGSGYSVRHPAGL